MMSRLDSVNQSRQEKLEQLRADGIDPYPGSCRRSHTNAQAVALLEQHDASGEGEAPEASVAGRITAQRRMGKISFIDIRDGSGKIQLYFNKDKAGEAALKLLDAIDIGDFVQAAGSLIRTRSGEPTIEVREFNLLAKSMLPLPEKWHGLSDVDTRHRQRYLDLIANPEVREIFQTRSRIITTIREFLNRRGFIEVETPVLQPAAGGALARPFTTHHHALGQDFYLRIEHEQHLKRLIVGGQDQVNQLGRIFRN